MRDIRKQIDSTATNFFVIGLNEVKDYLHISATDDDNILSRLINQCIAAVEEYCAISLIPKLITWTEDMQYNQQIEFPYGPVASITSIKVRDGSDSAGVAKYDTLIATDYYIDGDLFKVLSATRDGRYVSIYKTLYPEDEMPDDLKLSLLRLIAYCYENRGDGELKAMYEGLDLFMSAHRRMCWI